MTSAAWRANAPTGDFNTGTNWEGDFVPNETASFRTSTTTSLSISSAAVIGGWTFDAGADDYDFTNSSTLDFNGNGIQIDGGSAAITNAGTLRFFLGSSAGSATITNNVAATLSFNNGSTAGSADIINSGLINFNNAAMAASAGITNNGTLFFNNASTADSATIINNGTLTFNHTATARGATISTANGATTNFQQTVGDTNDATLIATGTGQVNFGLDATVGSIGGTGIFNLGASQLIVGNSLSTVVNGVISGAGGSLVKTGTGALNLSGTNAYSGNTTVNNGILQVDDNSASNNTFVNNGGTLHGSGIVGNVTVNSGGTLDPGPSIGGAGQLDTGNLTLNASATLSIELGGAVPGDGVGKHDQLRVTGAVDLGGATLQGALINGPFNPAAGTDFIVIDNDGIDDVIGTFTGLAEGDTFSFGDRMFSISYEGGDGNDVVLSSTGADWIGATGDYNTGSNWTGGAVPDGLAANFGDTGNTSIAIGSDGSTTAWTFAADAQNYDFTISAGNTFQFTGGGIAINGGSAGITNDGALQFAGTSTAGSADITNNNFLGLYGNSTLGTADITNTGSISFSGSSSAGDATIDSIATLFSDNSTGGNAQLTNTSVASIANFSLGTGPNDDKKLGIGSIAGMGQFRLGDNELTTGGNDSSTEVSGVISGTGGSLVKTGSGTLILSGNNTHTGGTTINQGTLQVDGAILGTTAVNDGGTLSGSGTTGAVNVASGGTVGPGASAGMLSTGAIAFAAGATFAAELGGDTAGSEHDQLAVTGTVDLGGADLDLSFLGAFNPDTGGTTEFVIVDNDGTADAVTGTFAGLTEGEQFVFDGRFFKVTYEGGDGNDVALTSHGASIRGTGGADRVDASNAPAGQSPATELRDVINGLSGNDNIRGLGGNDLLIGSGGRDILNGGAGTDVLNGGRHRDVLTGGADRDFFDFNHIKDSARGGAKRDVIKDFTRGNNVTGDEIDLRTIDAKSGGGNQKFKWIGKQDFHDKKGELHYIKKGGNVLVQGDINGDGKADFEILVQGVGALSKGDFLL